MSESLRIGLDNPAFTGRLRTPQYQRSYGTRRERPRPSATYFNRPAGRHHTAQKQPDTSGSPAPIWSQPLSVPKAPPSVPAAPAAIVPEAHTEAMESIKARLFAAPVRPHTLTAWRPRFQRPQYTRLQWALVTAAVFVFVFGVAASMQGLLANHNVTAQVAALSKRANKPSDNAVPSTTKPSANAFSNYMVAPDLPRYIKIPKLGVDARVLQVGVNSSGALGTPNNVYDTAWYTGSAKPGQPGAVLIDGHVSSWTTHGVFYDLKNLVAGDIIQLQRGDGQLLTYQVLKTHTYEDDKVDMQSAMMPIATGQPGLNLITCTGKVKPGTSEFNQRLVVFAKQI